MIYFIKSESGHIKIGYSEDKPEDRIRNLQCGNPFKLTILAMLHGDRTQEKLIHKKFWKLHFRGEWFYYTTEIKAFIDKPYKLSSSEQKSGDHCESFKVDHKQLKAKYKTHERVAAMLGITGRHYVRIRKGETKPKKSMAYMIEHLLKAEN